MTPLNRLRVCDKVWLGVDQFSLKEFVMKRKSSIALCVSLTVLIVRPAQAEESRSLAPASRPAAHRTWLENGDFSQGEIGKLPAGWTVSTPNPALAPTYKLVRGEDGKNLLLVEGNGRKECFGSLRHAVNLAAGKTYRFRVRFKFDGFDDVNRHLVHNVYAYTSGNDGIFHYRKGGEWVVGEAPIVLAGKGDVRLYFRFAPEGRVWYSQVSLTECEPVKPRPVKIAVTQGPGDRKRWEKFLDTAGAKHCDVALMGEFFNGNSDPQKPDRMDGPWMKFMSQKAKQWKMYVAGTLLLKQGDLVFNSCPLWDRQGKLVGIYNKNMLYDPELDNGTSGGAELPVFRADFGKVGIMTCYDSWHPEVARLLGYKGAELILFPSAGYYMQLMHARAADNGVVIAASSGSPCGVWDSGGNQADGGSPDPTRFAPTSIVGFEKDDGQKAQFVTVDLSKKPSPHYWGGPMLSAPGGRRVRATSPNYLEDEIAREARRWWDEPEPTNPSAARIDAKP
jgi:predicted amidohydrolase